ncbi:helix-turn-helix domain-containing protein [Aureisphaera galaxeae]|uniref:helix-turn-helix domain-containing protein n=1 Tax=Aureisphaera galaxeae TaxID=1538023 RepID=UPI002350D50F|nr:helix-turn-helix domain-containing protein [Aureisphaera galaxeae]MDC8004340.1 helix-turn-helix domain-containing protein [Aureisphaera galaxeae]
MSFYLLFFRKKNRLPNYFLGLLILMLSIRIGKSVYMVFNEDRVLLYLQIGLSACFLIGVMLYYYIKSQLENSKKVPISWKLHIAGLLCFIVVLGMIYPYEVYPELWRSYSARFIYAVWGIYLVLSGYMIRSSILKIFKKGQAFTTQELWLLLVYTSTLLIFIAYNIGMYRWYITGALTFSFALYGIIFFLLLKKNRAILFQDPPAKYKAKKIETSEADEIVHQLEVIMKEKELFMNPDMKLKDLAKEVQISSHKLSQLLNDNLGKSFNHYINEYRVEKAKALLKEENPYTLEAIGFEAGFSSKSSFYSIFKRITGMTPSEFKE